MWKAQSWVHILSPYGCLQLYYCGRYGGKCSFEKNENETKDYPIIYYFASKRQFHSFLNAYISIHLSNQAIWNNLYVNQMFSFEEIHQNLIPGQNFNLGGRGQLKCYKTTCRDASTKSIQFKVRYWEKRRFEKVKMKPKFSIFTLFCLKNINFIISNWLDIHTFCLSIQYEIIWRQ